MYHYSYETPQIFIAHVQSLETKTLVIALVLEHTFQFNLSKNNQVYRQLISVQKTTHTNKIFQTLSHFDIVIKQMIQKIFYMSTISFQWQAVCMESQTWWSPTSNNFIIQFNHPWHFTCTIPWSTIVLHRLQNSTPRRGKCDELTDIQRWISAGYLVNVRNIPIFTCLSMFKYFYHLQIGFTKLYKFTNVFQLSRLSIVRDASQSMLRSINQHCI